MTPLVSVILPVYNVEKDLPRCLDSLDKQTLPKDKWELIAVNDGSTDDSLGIVQNHIRLFPQIQIISQENRGLAAARNRGIAAAKGDFIAFVDSDDCLMPDYLTALSESLESSRADMVIADAFMNRGNERISYIDGRVWDYLEKSAISAGDLKMYPKTLLFQPSVWRRMYRRDFLTKNGFTFSEGLIFEDMPFHFQTMSKAEWIVFYPRQLYCYNDSRSESITNTRGDRIFDVFPIFRKVHDIVKADYTREWLLYAYLFEFRTLKWAQRQVPAERHREFSRNKRTSLAYYSLSIHIHGWFFRLKQKVLNRI